MTSKKKVIWYIDRDEQISGIIRAESLKESDAYEVIVINSPVVIDDKLKERLPDVIFIDMSIVGEGKTNSISELKSRDDTRHIPIILTAMDVKIEYKAEELGADDFLGKPIDLKAFFEKADEAVSGKKKKTTNH